MYYAVEWKTFEGENFRESVGSENFAEKTFTEYYHQAGCGIPKIL
jgi:hypothetical protein